MTFFLIEPSTCYASLHVYTPVVGQNDEIRTFYLLNGVRIMYFWGEAGNPLSSGHVSCGRSVSINDKHPLDKYFRLGCVIDGLTNHFSRFKKQ